MNVFKVLQKLGIKTKELQENVRRSQSGVGVGVRVITLSNVPHRHSFLSLSALLLRDLKGLETHRFGMFQGGYFQ